MSGEVGEVLKKIFEMVAKLICELPDGALISVTIPVKPDCGVKATFEKT